MAGCVYNALFVAVIAAADLTAVSTVKVCCHVSCQQTVHLVVIVTAQYGACHVVTDTSLQYLCLNLCQQRYAADTAVQFVGMTSLRD